MKNAIFVYFFDAQQDKRKSSYLKDTYQIKNNFLLLGFTIYLRHTSQHTDVGMSEKLQTTNPN